MTRLELSVNLNKIWLLGDKKAREDIILAYLKEVKKYLIRLNLTEDLDNLAYQVIDTIIDDYFASRNPDFILFFRKDIKKVLENQEKKYK